jgi:hypothetical protein
MFKSFTILLFSSLFILSMLGPVYIVIMDSDGDKMVLIDFSEEERQSETEKTLEDYKVTVKVFFDLKTILYSSNKNSNSFYPEEFSTFTSKVDLPPPKIII